MSVFVDTSALYAILDAADHNHSPARATWADLLRGDAHFLCTNYVLLETFALVQNRLGMTAVRTLREDLLPVLQVIWVDAERHGTAVTAMLTAGRRQLSLVDCVSFGVMRELGLTTAFTFDSDFMDQGFECMPVVSDAPGS
jgi:predicted nucleic acid-binding protein